MREREAVQRIATAIAGHNMPDTADLSFARLAWDEMKAIAREDKQASHMAICIHGTHPVSQCPASWPN